MLFEYKPKVRILMWAGNFPPAPKKGASRLPELFQMWGQKGREGVSLKYDRGKTPTYIVILFTLYIIGSSFIPLIRTDTNAFFLIAE